ncbi:TetR/AcrR family transcriptional regulator [Pseudomonas knackmussii]|uniref:TetR/AcrR family transcriptional regulator n=1 Tax=Pseudomonas knackmussii TaxID=65741 RepID=UPI003F4A7D5D
MAGVKQFDEDQALERALEVFWQQGFAATSMQDLAQATGVLRGSLYNAYGDKQAMFLEVFRRYQERFFVAVRELLASQPADEALAAFFDFIIESMTSGDPSRGCLTTKTATDETAMAEPIREALRAFLDGLEALLHERFDQDDARALLNLEPDLAARLVVTLTRGIVVIERVYQDPQRLREAANALLAVLFKRKG